MMGFLTERNLRDFRGQNYAPLKLRPMALYKYVYYYYYYYYYNAS